MQFRIGEYFFAPDGTAGVPEVLTSEEGFTTLKVGDEAAELTRVEKEFSPNGGDYRKLTFDREFIGFSVWYSL